MLVKIGRRGSCETSRVPRKKELARVPLRRLGSLAVAAGVESHETRESLKGSANVFRAATDAEGLRIDAKRPGHDSDKTNAGKI